uniref:Uncharacterized protein n=1 Tax=Caenorhabditis tropicalis TaxID=1561998 RepID=A0A1I7U7W7_9PELO
MKESLIVNISKATCVVALAARNMLSILKHDTSEEMSSRIRRRGALLRRRSTTKICDVSVARSVEKDGKDHQFSLTEDIKEDTETIKFNEKTCKSIGKREVK